MRRGVVELKPGLWVSPCALPYRDNEFPGSRHRLHRLADHRCATRFDVLRRISGGFCVRHRNERNVPPVSALGGGTGWTPGPASPRRPRRPPRCRRPRPNPGNFLVSLDVFKHVLPFDLRRVPLWRASPCAWLRAPSLHARDFWCEYGRHARRLCFPAFWTP